MGLAHGKPSRWLMTETRIGQTSRTIPLLWGSEANIGDHSFATGADDGSKISPPDHRVQKIARDSTGAPPGSFLHAIFMGA